MIALSIPPSGGLFWRLNSNVLITLCLKTKKRKEKLCGDLSMPHNGPSCDGSLVCKRAAVLN